MTSMIQSGIYLKVSRSRVRASRSCLTVDSGQALVELALTLPLLLIILIGATEYARFAWASIETANAARAGVQYGAQNEVTAKDPGGAIESAALNDGANLSGLTATSSISCTCSTAPTATIACSTALTNCPAPAVVLRFVQVNTSSTITPLYHWVGMPATFTATGSAIMQIEQP